MRFVSCNETIRWSFSIKHLMRFGSDVIEWSRSSSSASAGQRDRPIRAKLRPHWLVKQALTMTSYCLSLFISLSLSLPLSTLCRSDHAESAPSFITHTRILHSLTSAESSITHAPTHTLTHMLTRTHPHTHTPTHTLTHTHFSSFDVSSGIVTRHGRTKMRCNGHTRKERKSVHVCV